MAEYPQKAFVDFLISFSDKDMDEAFLRTEHPPRLISQDRGWRLFLQQKRDEPAPALFHAAGKNGYKIWSLGEIFQYRDKSEDIQSILNRFIDDLIEEKARPQDLNGHFILISWNEKKRLFQIWTNRLGTFHSYYTQNRDGSNAIGSFFPAVSAVCNNRKLDWAGLSGFFGFGFFPQDRTYFENVKIMFPASSYLFDEKGRPIKNSRYWGWHHSPDKKRTYPESVSEFGELLKEILKEQSKDGRLLLPVSGGLDSRTIAALVPESSSIKACSYGWGPHSPEIEIAEKVASLRNFPFKGLLIEPNLFKRLDLIITSIEGFQDLTIPRQASIIDKIYPDADYIFAAHWGDVWCDDMGLVGKELTEDGVIDHLYKKMKNNSCHWLLENICAFNLKDKDPHTLLKDLLTEGMRYYKRIDDPDFRIKAFKTDNWSFRWTLASLRMFQPAVFPRLPFYDNRIADFFCTVPSGFVKNRRLQVDCLKNFAPNFARVKWQVYDTDLFRYKYFNNLLLPKRIFKKIIRSLKRERIIQRNWEMQFLYNEEGRRSLEHWLLRKGLKIHEFVSPAKIKPLIDILFSKYHTKDEGYSISMLLTFSAWLEKYG